MTKKNNLKHRVISVLIALLLLVGTMPIGAFASGSENDIKYVFNDETNFTTGNSASTINSEGKLAITHGDWVEFPVAIGVSGIYKIGVNALFMGQPHHIYVDGEEIGLAETTNSFAANNGPIRYDDTYAPATVYLEAGKHTIKVGSNPGNNTFLSYVMVTYVGAPDSSLQSIKIGGADLTDGETYPRGSNKITISYKYGLDDNLDGVTLTDSDGVKVNADIYLSEPKTEVIIAIKEALKYDEEYELSVSGLKMGESDIDAFVKIFKTSVKGETDEADIKATDITASFLFDTLNVSGEVCGEAGQKMSGIKLNIALANDDGYNETIGTDVLTDENGEFNISYEASGLEKGEYSLTVSTEYDAEGVLVSAPYTGGGEIFYQLKKSNDIAFGGGEITVVYSGSDPSLGWESETKLYPGSNGSVSFPVTFPKSGVWKITADFFDVGGEHTVDIDGNKVVENLGPNVNILTTQTNYPLTDGVWISEGTKTVTWKVSGSERIQALKFIYVGSGEYDSIKIGGVELEDDATYKRGSDKIEVSYSYQLSDALDGISLSNGEKEIPIDVSLKEDGKTIVILLKQTLDYGKDYEIDLSGIKTLGGDAVLKQTALFKTSSSEDADAATETLTVSNAKISEGVLTLVGILYGSDNQTIEGRKVTLNLKKSADATFAAKGDAFTNSDGAFTIKYTFTDGDTVGNYDVKAVSEYDNESSASTLYYLDSQTTKEALDMLADSTSAQEVADFANKYAEALNIDLSTDASGLTPITDVFPFMFGAEVSSYLEFMKLYNSAIAMGYINKATDGDGVEAIFTNETYSDALDIDMDKIGALRTAAKTQFYSDLAAEEDFENFGKLSEAIEKYFNKGLIAQEGISNITLNEITAGIGKVGSEAKYEITASEFNDVKEISLTFDVSDFGGSFTGTSFTSDLGNVTEKNSDGKLTYIITVDKPYEKHEIIGAFGICATSQGEYDIFVTGKATVDTTTDYDVTVDVTEKSTTLTASAQNTKNPVKGSSGGGVGGTTIKPSDKTDIPAIDNPIESQPEKGDSFTDVSKEHWAYESVEELLDRHIITMPEDKLYNPNRNVTRAEFIKMIVLSRQLDIDYAENVFSDVTDNDWYIQYVLAAYNHNLIKGDENGNFRPNDPITREDICVILARLINKQQGGVSEKFADDEMISDYAYDAVYLAKELGIINGVGDNLFAPKNNATRAETAKMIHFMLKGDIL